MAMVHDCSRPFLSLPFLPGKIEENAGDFARRGHDWQQQGPVLGYFEFRNKEKYPSCDRRSGKVGHTAPRYSPMEEL